MLETILPLIHFMIQGKSSGNDYELVGIHSDFCSHCFVKYDTVTERNGFTRNLRIGLVWVGLLPTLNCSQARIKSAIRSILPELYCIICYKKTVTLANLCK